MGVSHTEIEFAIVMIAYLIGITVKANPKINDKWIPSIVGITGGICGIVGYYFVPGFPSDNILNAVAIGIISGLASTGVNQAYKQLRSKEKK
ncbi:MAG: phage holin family protein [Lachnospiraceae bacterium]